MKIKQKISCFFPLFILITAYLQGQETISTAGGTADLADLRETLAGYVGENVIMTGIFTGFGSGDHTVSVLARTFYGTGTEARVYPGCFQTDHVIVRKTK